MNLNNLLLLLTTISVAFFYFRFRKKEQHLLFVLLLGSTVIEALVYTFKHILKLPYYVFYNLASIYIFTVWNIILAHFFGNSKFNKAILIAYLLFALCNLLFGQGPNVFNNYTFILSVVLFCFQLLFSIYSKYNDDENFYFGKNEIVLFSAVLLFYLGFSLLLTVLPAFKSKELTKTYQYISVATNSLYYTLINVYLFLSKPKRL